MALEYKGDDFLYLLRINKTGDVFDMYRFFNQTDGSRTIEADDIELTTKDKTGSDYGSVTENVTIEGVFTQNDPAIKFVTKAIRNKELVEIIRLDVRTKETEEGLYKLNNIEQTDSVGEFASYSIDATLNGSIKEGELAEVPEGAPDSEDDVEDVVGAEG